MHRQRICFIQGDGIGPEVMTAARPTIDAAVEAAYGQSRALVWEEALAGEQAYVQTGEYLPKETFQALDSVTLAIKGPLTTPVGKGFRSLNVSLRQGLDLYACMRPVRFLPGVVAPVKRPQAVDMVIFRENTEDVYAGIEWPAGSKEAQRLVAFLVDELGARIDLKAGIGIKPMTELASKRLVRKALNFALEQGRKSLTLVHKGNIMKHTEGAFRAWGYELAAQEFSDQTRLGTDSSRTDSDRVLIKDKIADAMFQELLLAPEDHDVLATTNLNGDYLSDALAAQVGGLGLAPGVNLGDSLALFEPVHGTAPDIAGQDKANPCGMILTGALLLEYIGWHEAAKRLRAGVEAALATKQVPLDLATKIDGARVTGCRAFGELVLKGLTGLQP